MSDSSTIEGRKLDHIELTSLAQTDASSLDGRFDYEPLLSAHPSEMDISVEFLGKRLMAPIWISSMTGGAVGTESINVNLARACKKHGLAMALGSCRALLEDSSKLSDFDVRSHLGEDLPLYANLGIAQVEELLEQNSSHKTEELVSKLRADGVIVHINPLQEFMQPEGDKFKRPPLETLEELLEKVSCSVIVKEVGQGMGPHSLAKLMALPLAAIEFAAYGGTNFSKIEQLRSPNSQDLPIDALTKIGHSASEMVFMANQILLGLGDAAKCTQFIISGGVKSCLDGHYLIEKCEGRAIYGAASRFLAPAAKSFEEIDRYLASEIETLKMAKAFLRVRNN